MKRNMVLWKCTPQEILSNIVWMVRVLFPTLSAGIVAVLYTLIDFCIKFQSSLFRGIQLEMETYFMPVYFVFSVPYVHMTAILEE